MATPRPLPELLDAIEHGYRDYSENLSGTDDEQVQRLFELGNRVEQIRAMLSALYRITHPAADDTDVACALSVIEEVTGVRPPDPQEPD